nr:MAG TPA: hypothetical protein [Caudoviricetes sp.]
MWSSTHSLLFTNLLDKNFPRSFGFGIFHGDTKRASISACSFLLRWLPR